MKFARVMLPAALALAAGVLSAHDMFLKPVNFFPAPNSTFKVAGLNGTFTTSENAVTGDRIADLSVATASGRTSLPIDEWKSVGKMNEVTVTAGAAGTYAIGVSVKPNRIDLTADQFNEYLRSDGVRDVLAARRSAGELGKPAREQYSKHLKTLVQVGDTRDAGFGAVFGYPAELVALTNPYAPGAAEIRVRALVDGRPRANQLLQIGGRTHTGARLPVSEVRTDAQGEATIKLRPGVWFVKFIHMEKAPAGAGVDYESKWATLTFAVR